MRKNYSAIPLIYVTEVTFVTTLRLSPLVDALVCCLCFMHEEKKVYVCFGVELYWVTPGAPG